MCVTYFTFISGDLLRRGLLVDKLKWLRLNYGFGVRQISSLATTKVVRNLPLIQVEVLATTREEMLLRETNVNLLCHLVLDWIQRSWESSQLNVDQLTAKVLFLLLLLLLLALFLLFSLPFGLIVPVIIVLHSWFGSKSLVTKISQLFMIDMNEDPNRSWLTDRAAADGFIVDWLQTHLLYLNLDNSLHDCVEVESGDVIDSDIVQDYKKMSIRLSQPGSKVNLETV